MGKATKKTAMKDNSRAVINTTELKKEVLYSLKEQYDYNSDKVIFFHHGLRNLMLLNARELAGQIKEWKEKDVVVQDYNVYEKQVNGQTWYMFIAQPRNKADLENCNYCPLALAFGVLVSGFAYLTHQKEVVELVKRVLNQ